MKSLSNKEDRTEVLERLKKVGPDSRRVWGKMNSHQMICHLSDSFKLTMGEKEAATSAANLFNRTVIKWIALKAPLSWPKGVKTRPEVDQEIGGTKPIEFEKDVKELEKLIDRFSKREKDFEWQAHPIFGMMTEEEWQRWGYLHMDHHLRQFGA